MIPFERVVPLEIRNPTLAEELFRFGGLGLLRRAVEGFERVLDRGRYARPKAARIATLKWMHYSDPVKIFAEECLDRTGDPKDRIRVPEMFERCREFCHTNRLPLPTSEKALRGQLERLQYQCTKVSTMHWIGVRFRD